MKVRTQNLFPARRVRLFRGRPLKIGPRHFGSHSNIVGGYSRGGCGKLTATRSVVMIEITAKIGSCRPHDVEYRRAHPRTIFITQSIGRVIERHGVGAANTGTGCVSRVRMTESLTSTTVPVPVAYLRTTAVPCCALGGRRRLFRSLWTVHRAPTANVPLRIPLSAAIVIVFFFCYFYNNNNNIMGSKPRLSTSIDYKLAIIIASRSIAIPRSRYCSPVIIVFR